MPHGIDDLAQDLLHAEGAHQIWSVQLGVAEGGEPRPYAARKRGRPGASTSASAAGSRWAYFAATIPACASDCTIPATSSAAGIGRHPLLRGEHGIAVEVRHHEPAAAEQYLADVQIAVSLDDGGACGGAQSVEDPGDFGPPRPCARTLATSSRPQARRGSSSAPPRHRRASDEDATAAVPDSAECNSATTVPTGGRARRTVRLCRSRGAR